MRVDGSMKDTASRGFLAAATDPRGCRWQPQMVILGTYLLLAGLSSLSSSGAISGLAVTVIAPAAWAVQWGLMWLANRAFLARAWWRRHPLWSSVVLLVIVMCAAIVTGIAGGSVSATDGWTVLWRWGLTLVVTAIVVVAVDYRDDVRAEEELQSQLIQTRTSAIEQVIAQRAEVVTRMLRMWTDAVSSVTSGSAVGGEAMKTFAREQVRPLSHELMEALPDVSAPRAQSSRLSGWREVLSRVTATPLVRPTLMAIAVTILFLLTTVQVTTADAPAQSREGVEGDGVVITVDVGSLLLSFFLLAVVFAATWFSAWLLAMLTGRILPRLGLGRRVALAAITPVLIALVVEIAIQIAYITPGFADSLSSSLVVRLWLAVPIVVVAFLILIVRVLIEAITVSRLRAQRMTEDLTWETTRLRNTMTQERQFFATQLHGPIQSVAAAAALRMETVDQSTDVNAILDEVEHDLTAAMHRLSEGPPERRNFADDVTNLVGTWTGVCEVIVDIPAEIEQALDSDWVAAGMVMDLLTDAVANAAMHGRAKHVWISAQWVDDDEVGITVDNDGNTDLGEGRGLGSTLLDESCVSWSRGIHDGAVRLTFVVALPVVVFDSLAHVRENLLAGGDHHALVRIVTSNVDGAQAQERL